MSVGSGMRVLIVDPHVTSRLMIAGTLQSLGFSHITVAGDGEQGLAMMLQRPRRLVISDFRMPKMDGLDLLHAIRANVRTQDVAFIMVTAHRDRALMEKAARLGANNVLPKPLTHENIRGAIEAIFGSSG